MAIVSLDNVTVSIEGKKLLDAVSLKAYPGEVLGLIGPNGAGKSTLLSVLSGDRLPDSGEVNVGGLDPATAAASDMADRKSVV